MLQELRAVNDYLKCGYRLFFWRTRGKLEIDFYLYGPQGLLAIEIKRSTRVRGKDTKALREFKKDYPPAKGFAFDAGTTPLYLDNIIVLAVGQSLKELDAILGDGSLLKRMGTGL